MKEDNLLVPLVVKVIKIVIEVIKGLKKKQDVFDLWMQRTKVVLHLSSKSCQ
ncbi:7891_t:CDS:2, partial [Gigaspora margarita]